MSLVQFGIKCYTITFILLPLVLVYDELFMKASQFLC